MVTHRSSAGKLHSRVRASLAAGSGSQPPAVLVMHATLRVALILSVLVIVFLAVRGFRPVEGIVPEAVTASDPDAAELIAPPTSQRNEIVDAAPEASAREEVPPPEPQATLDAENRATILVQVRWDDDGSPGADLGVVAFPSSVTNPFLHSQRTVTDPDGRATFQVRAPGKVGVYLDMGNSSYVDLEPGDEHELELTAERWAVVHGRVVDHQGDPVPDAAIWVSAISNYSNGSVVAHSRPDGSFQVPIGMTNYIGARKAGHVPSHLLAPWAAEGAEVELELPLRGFSGRVLGTVRDADGQPVADALLHLGTLRGHIVHFEDGSQGTQAPGLSARTDGEGRFEIESAEPGSSHLLARAESFAVTDLAVVIQADETTVVDVVLLRGLTARGTVRDTEGKSLEQVTIRFGDYGQFDSGHTRSAADGTFVLTGGSPGKWELVASQRGLGKATVTLSGEPGAVLEWNPVLAPGLSMHGRLVDSGGAPLEGLYVNAEGPRQNGRSNRLQDQSAADGTFRLMNAKDTPYRLVVSAAGSDFSWYTQYGVRPSAEPLTIVIPDENRPSAHVQGRVVPPEGVQLTLAAYRQGESGGPFVLFDAESGQFDVGPWPPGSYRLVLVGQDYPRTTLASFELVSGEHRDLGLLQVEAPGTLEVTARGADGAPVREARVLVLDRSGVMPEGGELESDQKLSLELAPGSYVVRVSAEEDGAAHTLVDVFSGETTRVQLDLEAAATLALEITLQPDRVGERVVVTVRVVDAEGWTVAWQGYVVSQQKTTHKIPLAPGSYLIEASTKDGRAAEASASVTAGGSSPPVLLEIR